MPDWARSWARRGWACIALASSPGCTPTFECPEPVWVSGSWNDFVPSGDEVIEALQHRYSDTLFACEGDTFISAAIVLDTADPYFFYVEHDAIVAVLTGGKDTWLDAWTGSPENGPGGGSHLTLRTAGRVFEVTLEAVDAGGQIDRYPERRIAVHAYARVPQAMAQWCGERVAGEPCTGVLQLVLELGPQGQLINSRLYYWPTLEPASDIADDFFKYSQCRFCQSTGALSIAASTLPCGEYRFTGDFWFTGDFL